MTFSGWWLLVGAMPIIFLGERIAAKRGLSKLDIPAPLWGGLVVAACVLVWNIVHITSTVKLDKEVVSSFAAWFVRPEPLVAAHARVDLALIFSTAFFCCVGLSASWKLVKAGGRPLVVLLVMSTVLAVSQNALGIILARMLHQHAALGVVCGSMTLTGGPSTALAFASQAEAKGLPNADAIGAVAAMFGIVVASLIAGGFGGQLIRWLKLAKSSDASASETTIRKKIGITKHLVSLANSPERAFVCLLTLLVCMKAGAWVGYALKELNITLPVYMGALLVGLAVRQVHDSAGWNWLQQPTINAVSGVMLTIFLAMAIASLNLLQLRSLALPLLIILSAEVVLTVFISLVTFVLLKFSYEAAVGGAGFLGFGLGITPNAVAAVDGLTQKFGPAPQMLLAVTIVGAFLLDIPNGFIINFTLNHLVK